MITMIFEPSTPTIKVAARFAAYSLSTADTGKPVQLRPQVSGPCVLAAVSR